jgi:hypothetical protein
MHPATYRNESTHICIDSCLLEDLALRGNISSLSRFDIATWNRPVILVLTISHLDEEDFVTREDNRNRADRISLAVS